MIGHVVTWRTPSRVTLESLRAALIAANVSPDEAGDLHPRHALARALRGLEGRRIVRRLAGRDGQVVRFQLTAEVESGGMLYYDPEAVLSLDAHGVVTPDRESAGPLADRAAGLLADELATRITSDLTRLMQRLVARAGTDLIPIREQGGAYFVPATRGDVVETLRTVLDCIGGQLRTWNVTLGHGSDTSISDTVAEYLTGLVADWRESVAPLDEEAKASVRRRREDALTGIRSRVASYAHLLTSEASEHLVTTCEAADALLAERLAAPPAAGKRRVLQMEMTPPPAAPAPAPEGWTSVGTSTEDTEAVEAEAAVQ